MPLEGATVIIEGTTLGVITDSDGYFTLNDVPPQTYNIVASFLGYANQTEFNVIVKSVGTADLLFKLEEVSESLDEVVVAKSPFRTSKETPLSPVAFDVEIETYLEEITTSPKWHKVYPGSPLPLGGSATILSFEEERLTKQFTI